MAYMSQELKRELAPGIKAVLKKYGMKGSIGVRHYSALVVNIKSGDLNIMREINRSNREDLNIMRGINRSNRELRRTHRNYTDFQQRDHASLSSHSVDIYQGIIGQFVNEIIGAMMTGNFDKSDIMSDYHHVGWYIDINVGKYDTPYIWNALRQKVAA